MASETENHPRPRQFDPGLDTRRPPPDLQKRNVMDTLLGANKLAALDENGIDPYNATGRQFRR